MYNELLKEIQQGVDATDKVDLPLNEGKVIRGKAADKKIEDLKKQGYKRTKPKGSGEYIYQYEKEGSPTWYVNYRDEGGEVSVVKVAEGKAEVAKLQKKRKDAEQELKKYRAANDKEMVAHWEEEIEEIDSKLKKAKDV